MDASSITAQLMTLGDYLGSLPAIIAFTMGFVEVFKLLLIKYPVKYLSKIPTPLLAIVTAVGLTFFANYVLKSLPGDPVVLILRAMSRRFRERGVDGGDDTDAPYGPRAPLGTSDRELEKVGS